MDYDFDGWRQKRESAKSLWANGAKTKEIAAAAGVGIERARNLIRQWSEAETEARRAALSERIDEAAVILRDAGYSVDEIALLFRDEVWRISRILFDADMASGRLSGERFPVSHLELSVRAANVLDRAPVVTVGELASMSEAKLKSIKGCGAGTIAEIKSVLAERGYSLAE